jgi:hypothetical protein
MYVAQLQTRYDVITVLPWLAAWLSGIASTSGADVLWFESRQSVRTLNIAMMLVVH